MIQDDLIERLGRSQQKIMSLSVTCRRLERAEQPRVNAGRNP
jgi:hypothetical protein